MLGRGFVVIKEGRGGTISVESEEGKGSRFTVRLPLGRGPETQAEFGNLRKHRDEIYRE